MSDTPYTPITLEELERIRRGAVGGSDATGMPVGGGWNGGQQASTPTPFALSTAAGANFDVPTTTMPTAMPGTTPNQTTEPSGGGGILDNPLAVPGLVLAGLYGKKKLGASAAARAAGAGAESAAGQGAFGRVASGIAGRLGLGTAAGAGAGAAAEGGVVWRAVTDAAGGRKWELVPKTSLLPGEVGRAVPEAVNMSKVLGGAGLIASSPFVWKGANSLNVGGEGSTVDRGVTGAAGGAAAGAGTGMIIGAMGGPIGAGAGAAIGAGIGGLINIFTGETDGDLKKQAVRAVNKAQGELFDRANKADLTTDMHKALRDNFTTARKEILQAKDENGDLLPWDDRRQMLEVAVNQFAAEVDQRAGSGTIQKQMEEAARLERVRLEREAADAKAAQGPDPLSPEGQMAMQSLIASVLGPQQQRSAEMTNLFADQLEKSGAATGGTVLAAQARSQNAASALAQQQWASAMPILIAQQRAKDQALATAEEYKYMQQQAQQDQNTRSDMLNAIIQAANANGGDMAAAQQLVASYYGG